jgi:hypothetical protein
VEEAVSHGHHKTFSEAELRLPEGHFWNKLWIVALLVGLGGLGAAYMLMQGTTTKHFYFSYLTAYLYWLSLALGGLFFVIVQYAARAGWSIVVRRLAENAMIVLPVMAVLSIPIFLGMDELFHWAHYEHEWHLAEAGQAPAGFVHDKILEGKAGYLNKKFFYIRAVIYFVIWCGLAFYFHSKSVAQDRSGDQTLTRSLYKIAPIGIALYALSQTFASFDWIMGIDSHWFSTMYGVYFFAGSVVAIMAFLSLVSVGLRTDGLLHDVITPEHYHDLGKLLFAFVVFWAYISFSQYMLYWYANIPEETMWFSHRWVGDWQGVSVVLGAGHFVVPFYFLMSRHIKRRPITLAVGAIWMLVMHYIDLYWQIMPEVHKDNPHFSLLDLATFVGIGGVFLAVFFLQLKRHPIVPAKDPRLSESIAHENY